MTADSEGTVQLTFTQNSYTHQYLPKSILIIVVHGVLPSYTNDNHRICLLLQMQMNDTTMLCHMCVRVH